MRSSGAAAGERLPDPLEERGPVNGLEAVLALGDFPQRGPALVPDHLRMGKGYDLIGTE